MKSIFSIFSQHPSSVGESWGEHAANAWSFSWQLQLAAIAALIHAVLPFMFTKTASKIVTNLHDRMVIHRSKSASDDFHAGQQ
jgi:hypothetical protein